MSTPIAEPSFYTQLRNEAEARLESGTAAASNWSLGVDALQMLHKLSSDPQTAADALKLLHELQVHQVELDLQSEEMRGNEQHLAKEISHYKDLYEFAPLGYFLIDFQGVIAESNRAGAELFGAGLDQLTGARIDQFLADESRQPLSGMLERLGKGSGTQACEVSLGGISGASRPLQLVANVSPDKRCVLLACCERT